MADEFNIDASREDHVTCLQQMLNGTRNPNNILNDVNPFAHHPKNLPGDILYLGNFDLSESNPSGYWQQSGEDARIVTISFTVGWMKELVFFEGQAPNARRTDWTMQLYRLDDHNRQDCCLLCRIRGQMNGDDDNMEQALLAIQAPEENLPNSQNNSQGSQVVNGNEHGSLDRNLSIDDGYLEMNDLIGYESSSSSGENSSRMAITSDEYMDDDFNSEATLSDRESHTGPILRQNLSRCTALPTLGNDRVVIKLPFSGVHGEEHKGNEDTRLPPKPATAESKKLGGPSVSVPPTAHLGGLQTDLGEPQAKPSTSAPRGEKKQGSKMTKIGKKFCCCFSL